MGYLLKVAGVVNFNPAVFCEPDYSPVPPDRFPVFTLVPAEKGEIPVQGEHLVFILTG